MDRKFMTDVMYELWRLQGRNTTPEEKTQIEIKLIILKPVLSKPVQSKPETNT